MLRNISGEIKEIDKTIEKILRNIWEPQNNGEEGLDIEGMKNAKRCQIGLQYKKDVLGPLTIH